PLTFGGRPEMLRIGAFAFAMLCLTQQGFAQDRIVPSVWEDQRGSIMKVLRVDRATGNFSGVYISNAQGFECAGTSYPLEGRAIGPEVFFRVVWRSYAADCHAATTWHGRVSDWNLPAVWVMQIEGRARPVFNGEDEFRRR